VSSQAVRHVLHTVILNDGFGIEEEYAVHLKTATYTSRRIIDGPYRHLDMCQNAFEDLVTMSSRAFKDWLLANNLPVLTGTIPVPTDGYLPIVLQSASLNYDD
jgi:glyceraldehyde-3-phosphate dehydrogenase/erythrose-4-phosphate dehydrogenase